MAGLCDLQTEGETQSGYNFINFRSVSRKIMPIVVFGSINLDLTAYVPRLPHPGETISGNSFITVPGGKGSNQAVCARRLGAPTHFIGRTGQDAFGREVLDAVSREGVDTSRVFKDPAAGTGLAVISVDEHAENSIIIIPGANGRLDASDVQRAADLLDKDSILMLQLETPLASSLELARIARKLGAKVILDPAPAFPLPEEVYRSMDILTPNEGEIGILTGIRPETREDCECAAEILISRGVSTVAIKMGAKGVFFQSLSVSGFIDPFKVEAIDSVAAGDAFNGGLAVALSEGKDLKEAVRWGAAAGALACTRKGAMPSMPRRDELETLVSVQA
jgi:ribokinase